MLIIWDINRIIHLELMSYLVIEKYLSRIDNLNLLKIIWTSSKVSSCKEVEIKQNKLEQGISYNKTIQIQTGQSLIDLQMDMEELLL